jgi:hypothetical protein
MKVGDYRSNIRTPHEITEGEFSSFVRCIEALDSRPVGFTEEELAALDVLNAEIPMKEAIRLVLLMRKDQPK